MIKTIQKTMLHHPSKYHSNPLSHFLALHSSNVSTIGPSSDSSDRNAKIDMEHCNNTQTSLDEISGNIGKSFTIAAILGLKKNAAAVAAAAAMENHHHHHHHHLQHNNNKDFTVMNLSLNGHSVKSSLSLNNDGYGGGGGGGTGGGGSVINGNQPAETRLLSTNSGRLPLGLGQHFSSHHHHHTHNSNHHGTASALQSLQQLQQQHNQNAISFHGRERSSKNGNHNSPLYTKYNIHYNKLIYNA